MRLAVLTGAAVLAAALAGCTSTAGTAPDALGGSSAPASTSSAPALHKVHDPGQVTGTLAGPCTYRDPGAGELPDPHCTPGAYDPAVTAAVLCAPGYSTKSYRPPESQTAQFKYGEAYPAYALPSTARTELDHLVSLELGGSNDASNLWPEAPPTPNPKDKVENALHAWVCAATGKAARDRLAKAQLAIADNWTTAEKVLGTGSAAAPSPSASRIAPAPAPSTSRATAPRHTSTPAPPPSTHAPVAAACSPLSSTGHCYRRGEFCPAADHGLSGTDASGSQITCEDTGSRWRWELATLGLVTTTAVIVPSARRPANAKRLARAFRNTTTDPDTYLLLAVDDDDPYLDAYRMVQRAFSEVCHLHVVRDSPHRIGPIINDVTRELLEEDPPPDFIGFMGDDHEPETPGWDTKLPELLGGRPGVAYGNDRNQGSKLPTACLISTPVVAALGYLVPPGMHHLYLDDFWLMLGHATCLAYRDEVVIEHLHPTVGKAPVDETYLAAGCNPGVFAADADRYQQYMEGGGWAAALARLGPLAQGIPGAL